MYHIRLKKALSYSGIVKATKESPDLFINDKATAEKAVATGYFELIGEGGEEGSPEHTGQPTTGHLDRAQIEGMDYNDLKKLAADLGVDTKIVKKKADIIEAVLAIEVGIPAYDDLTDEEKAAVDAAEAGEENEVDYGEGGEEGSPTMIGLQEN